jgi:hypothetical protein
MCDMAVRKQQTNSYPLKHEPPQFSPQLKFHVHQAFYLIPVQTPSMQKHLTKKKTLKIAPIIHVTIIACAE